MTHHAELEVAFEGDGAQPVKVPVEGVPAPSPPPAPVATTLTQACPAAGIVDPQTLKGTITVTGNLAGAPADATVDVTFTDPPRDAGSPKTVTLAARIDGSGNWTATLDTVREDLGNWTVSSVFAERSGYLGSTAGPCTVTLQPPGGSPVDHVVRARPAGATRRAALVRQRLVDLFMRERNNSSSPAAQVLAGRRAAAQAGAQMMNTLRLTAVASEATGLTPVARQTVHADPSAGTPTAAAVPVRGPEPVMRASPWLMSLRFAPPPIGFSSGAACC